jgi:hypothetical protein
LYEHCVFSLHRAHREMMDLMEKPVKKAVEDFLITREHGTLLDLCEQDRRFWQEVRFRLYDLDERIRWSAIEATAKLMERWWQSGKEEKVRIYIRTLFWSMNDESGGFGWSSPQTIAEIIMHIPELIDPYGRMMIAHSIEEPPLMKGGAWGIGRLGRMIETPLEVFREEILAVFQADDSETLGFLAWAMGRTGFSPAMSYLEMLLQREEPVMIYIDSVFLQKPLKKWAEEAIGAIKTREIH